VQLPQLSNYRSFKNLFSQFAVFFSRTVMQPTPPPPPVLAVPKAATSAPTQPGKSLQDLMREKQLKQTEGPQVRGLGLKVVNVLLVTKFWGCYNWLSEV
jgi:hypothetical protein